MAESENKAKTKPPKGGRKGGTLYPKINLEEALGYSEKLVAKTHTGAQPAATILPGVFESPSTTGKVRASAVKQFGLLGGDISAYQATELAKKIVAATPEERPGLVRSALLNSKLFKEIFDTFHGDTVTKAKIKQRTLGLNVHPESADECVELFVDSAVTAGLASVNGDSIVLVSAGAITPVAAPSVGPNSNGPDEGREVMEDVDAHAAEGTVGAKNTGMAGTPGVAAHTNKAGVTVNLNVDSSSDPDKLQKQLELLKKFGVI
jgi:hypothetical protein